MFEIQLCQIKSGDWLMIIGRDNNGMAVDISFDDVVVLLDWWEWERSADYFAEYYNLNHE